MISLSPKLLISGLSGIGIVTGSLAVWQLTKKTDLPTLNQIPNTNQNQQKLEEKIRSECGEQLLTDWYEDDQAKTKKYFTNKKGRTSKKKGVFKKNGKGHDEEGYEKCISNINSNWTNTKR